MFSDIKDRKGQDGLFYAVWAMTISVFILAFLPVPELLMDALYLADAVFTIRYSVFKIVQFQSGYAGENTEACTSPIGENQLNSSYINNLYIDFRSFSSFFAVNTENTMEIKNDTMPIKPNQVNTTPTDTTLYTGFLNLFSYFAVDAKDTTESKNTNHATGHIATNGINVSPGQ